MPRTAIFLLLLIIISTATAQPTPVALVGAKILPVAGKPIERGTILIEGGKIKAVGANVEIPANAQRIDLTGKVVLPGLVDAHSSLFLAADDLNATGAADRDVTDALDLFDKDAEKVLARGVTTLYVSPGNRGNVNGVGAVVQLNNTPPYGRVLKPRAALKLTLGVSTNNRSTSLERLASYEALRAAFHSAQQYAKSFERYERDLAAYARRQKQPQPTAANPQPTAPASSQPTKPTKPRRNPAQEILVAALKGEIPVRIEAHRVDDILNALRLADEFKFKLILERATEGAQIANDIARRHVPVVWGPTLPMGAPRLETLNHSPDGAAQLAKAGVKVALTTDGASGLSSRFLLENAAAAVGFGMSADEALRAVTLSAAEVLGVADRVGSIEVGKDANLVVLSASPWDATAQVEQVWVEGRLTYEKK
ncbi:MAG: amidohydrolase family protein [Abditibacteriales bacterium]|nr:amidohydrolase family protein [Abditibacteriales bacterium]MDW8366943.1 amidohydrolase family protein [Abditibacteriales bacterium]